MNEESNEDSDWSQRSSRVASKVVMKILVDSMKWERSRTREPTEGKKLILWVCGSKKGDWVRKLK